MIRITTHIFLVVASLVFSATLSFAQTGPGGVGTTDGTSALELWLKADTQVFNNGGVSLASNGQSVQEWHDQSGNNRDATQTANANKPTFLTNVMHDKPVVRFDGNNDLLDDVRNYNAQTVFIVYDISNNGDLAQLWGHYDGGHHVAAEARNNGNFKGFSFDGNASATAIYAMNGVSFTGSAQQNDNTQTWNFGNIEIVSVEYASAQAMTRQTLGSLNRGDDGIDDLEFQGDIAEVIVYSNTLSPVDRAKVEEYLFEKYFYGFEATHGTDITGIGHSIAGTAQSSNVSSLLTIDNGILGADSYVFFGHDNASAAPLADPGDLPLGINKRMQRVWRIDVEQGGGSVDLTFDLTDVVAELAPNEAFRMLVDTDGDFSDAAQFVGSLVGNNFKVSRFNTNDARYITIGKVSASANTQFFSFTTGNWADASTWTQDPTGLLQVPVGGEVPTAASKVTILNGRTVTVGATEASKSQSAVIIETGAILDMTTNSNPHAFTQVSGSGRLRLSSTNLPNGVYTDFVASSGGTIEYYDVTGTLPGSLGTYNNLEFTNSLGPNQTMTLGHSITLNGDFDLISTGAGQSIFQIGNSTSALTITANGDVNVGTNSQLNSNNFNADHTFSVLGNMTIDGSVDFDVSAGDVNLIFAGSSNTNFAINGSTELFNLTLNKGIDQTFVLNVTSDNATNLSIPTNNIIIQNGTLRLGANISMGDVDDGNGGNYDISVNQNKNAALWVDGATLNFNRPVVVYGTYRQTAGTVTVRQQGMVNREDGAIIIEGGTLNVSKYRISSSSVDHRGSFSMSGGIMNVNRALGTSNAGFAAFSMPFATQSFAMSGGTINVLYAEPNGTAQNGGIQINADDVNVTGGTWNIHIPNTAINFGIATKAPFWNLNIERDGTAGAGVARIQDVNSSRGNVAGQDLVVLNNFTLSATNNPIFDANGFNVTVRNNFTVNAGATFENTGATNNTTTFDQIASQAIVLNAPVTFDNLSVQTGVNANFSGSNNPAVSGNLTIGTGNLVDGGLVFTVNGNVSNSGSHTGAGRILLSGGAGVHVVSGDGTGSFNNIELDDVIGVDMTANTRIIGTLTMTNGDWDINDKRMTLGTSGSISGASPVRRIVGNGISSDGGLQKEYASSGGSFTFPLGTAALFTPATLNVTNTDGSAGAITVVPVSTEHPNVSAANVSLNHYWKVTKTGFGATPTVTHSYTYDQSNVFGTEANYVYGRFDSDAAAWSSGATADVNDTANLIGGAGTNLAGVNFIKGNFTAGEVAAFGAVTVFYSRTNGEWSTPSTWSTVGFGGSAASSAPGSGDIVLIGDGGSNNHTITISTGNVASSTLRLASGSVLNLNATSGHNFGTALEGSGNSGFGTIRLSSANFPAGNFANFVASGGGTIEYFRNASNIVLPNTQGTYNNLTLSTQGGAAGTITLPNADLTINGNLRVGATSNSANLTVQTNITAAHSINVSGTLTVNGAVGKTTDFVMLNGNVQTLNVNSDVTVDGNSTFRAENAGSTVHALNLAGSFTNNGTVQFAQASEVNVTFTGTTNKSILGSGTTFTFNNLNVNKGSSQTPRLDVNAASFSVSGAIALQNGTLRLTDASILTLANSGSFSIPASARLWMNGATAQITGTGNMILEGALLIDSGVLNIGTTNQNNFLQYTGTGNPEITVNGGTLQVASQLRRPTSVATGNLSYSQTGGTVIVGQFQAPSNSRGVFEVANSGNFVMSGGTLNVVRMQSAATDNTAAALLITPSNSTVTGGTINLGTANTPSGQNMRVNSSRTLRHIVVGSTNTPSATLVVNPLILTGNLTIGTGSQFSANDLDVTIGGDFSNGGTYVPGTNITTMNTVAQQISGATTFNNLTYSGGGTLTLAMTSNLTINSNLDIGSGTLAGGANQINIKGNYTNSGAHTGTGKILLNGSATQIISGDGTGILGNTEIDNPNGATMSASFQVGVTHSLTLTTGLLKIGSSQLEILNTSVSAVTGGSFSAAKMIRTNGSLTDGGIIKHFATGAADFTFPVGSGLNFTPARFNVTTNSASGTIRVIPVALTIPSATDDEADGNDLLSYYWVVSSTGFSGLNVVHEYTYDDSDIQLLGGDATEADYVAARFVSPTWTSGASLGSVTTATNLITIDGGVSGVAFLDGSYTAGEAEEFGSLATFYSFNARTSDDWDSPNNDTWSNTGHTGPPVNTVPNGNPVVIASGHTILVTTNSKVAATVDLQGTLNIGSTIGHNLGSVSGPGRLILTSSNFPGGEFSAFVSPSGGTVEYGAGNLTLPTQATYNNIELKSTGTKSLPNINISINGDVTVTAGTLSMASLSTNVSISGDWTLSGATFTPGNGTVSFTGTAAQSIGGTSATTFNNLTINNTAGVTASKDINVNSALQISSGTLNLNGNTADVNGNVTNNSSGSGFTGTGTVLLSGTSAQTIGGSAASTQLDNATLNNSSGATLGHDVTINGTLTFTSGNLTTSSNTLTLGTASGQLSGETASSFVIGTLKVSKNVGTSASTMGNIGFDIQSPGNDIGTVTVRRETGANADILVITGQSIERRWIVASTNSISGSRDIQVTWFPSEENGQDPTQMSMLKRPTEGSGEFSRISPFTDVSAQNPRTLVGSFTSFSEVVVTDDEGSLPVELIDFTGHITGINNEVALLRWSTATESKNFGFEIYRSTPGEYTETDTTWSLIGFVEGHGNSFETRRYSFEDGDLDVAGSYFYRLKQIDFDSEFEFFGPIEVSLDVPAEPKLNNNFPNPFNPTTTVSFELAQPGQVQIFIYDILGRRVATLVNGNLEAGKFQRVFDAKNLASGTYIIQMISQGRTFSQKILLLK